MHEHDLDAHIGTHEEACPNFIVDDYSISRQQIEPVTPTPLFARVISDSEAQVAPVEKPFKCPHHDCTFCK